MREILRHVKSVSGTKDERRNAMHVQPKDIGGYTESFFRLRWNNKYSEHVSKNLYD